MTTSQKDKKLYKFRLCLFLVSDIENDSQTGKLDGYRVSDISFNWNITDVLSLRGGVNNIENRIYATRRASGYPGPGIMPADGRTAYLGLGAIF